jgi:hypothetical protein
MTSSRSRPDYLLVGRSCNAPPTRNQSPFEDGVGRAGRGGQIALYRRNVRPDEKTAFQLNEKMAISDGASGQSYMTRTLH